jgi:hypothetical protein
MIILALDALDFTSVLKYNCEYLKQTEYGQIDVSDFKQLRTVALWASFLSGKNMEDEVPVDKATQWKFQLESEKTFLSFFGTYTAIDVPAFSLKQSNHLKERHFMRKFFEDEVSAEDFDSVIWKNHDENQKDFFKSLGKHDLVIGYFDLADAIGHLSFGVPKKMKEVYAELDKIAKEVKSSFDDVILIASDHGMRSVGRYGQHDVQGFYSLNYNPRFKLSRITEFHDLIKQIAENKAYY